MALRLESAHSIWFFDPRRMRFVRVPKDADPRVPALDADWQPYFGLHVDETGTGFTVSLDPEGTHLLEVS